MKFTELPLSEQVLAGVEKAGFTDCTQVQEKVLPISLEGRDVMVQSKTGSGKTAVYVLTLLERFIKNGKSTALVVAPTRELAVQIEEDAKLLASGIDGYRIGCFYGGVGYQGQKEDLKGGLDLYVGTPGRLLDFAQSRSIDFRLFDAIVLDEADRMFDMGFYPDVQRMFSMMRPSSERQTMLFSATLSTKVRNLAWQYMSNPEEIEVQPEEITVKNITQELFHVTKDEKFSLLLSILKKIDPQSCLIFTNTKDKAVEVSKRLGMNGYKAEYLMGDMPQSKRLATLERMKEGKLPFLVATDVAARGLQIDDLELVVNYDIPEDYENYVHRIGRTARAGKSGKAITLACEEYIYGLEPIENYIQMKIPVLWADECGLESVEDKSAGYRYRSRSRQGDQRRKPASSYGERKKPRSKADSIDRAVRRPESKKQEKKGDYAKLSKMSLEERMAYYRNEFSSDSAKGGKPAVNKASGKQYPKKNADRKPMEGKAPQAKPAQKSASPAAAPVQKSAAPEAKPAAPQKKSILSRIREFFGKRK